MPLLLCGDSVTSTWPLRQCVYTPQWTTVKTPVSVIPVCPHSVFKQTPHPAPLWAAAEWNVCFSNRQPSNLTRRHNECTLAAYHALLQAWMCIIWVWIQWSDTMSLLPALSAWVSSPEPLMREVGNTLTAAMTRRPPRRDTHKGVNHYVVYTEETPALLHWAHTGENPAMLTLLLFFFMYVLI